MKKPLILALVATLMVPLITPMAQAGVISRACLLSERKVKSMRLCNCIQRVANGNLSRNEQKIAAKFFKEPHRAQVMRQSSNILHERFWEKYKRFGTKVSSSCS